MSARRCECPLWAHVALRVCENSPGRIAGSSLRARRVGETPRDLRQDPHQRTRLAGEVAVEHLDGEANALDLLDKLFVSPLCSRQGESAGRLDAVGASLHNTRCSHGRVSVPYITLAPYADASLLQRRFSTRRLQRHSARLSARIGAAQWPFCRERS